MIPGSMAKRGIDDAPFFAADRMDFLNPAVLPRIEQACRSAELQSPSPPAEPETHPFVPQEGLGKLLLMIKKQANKPEHRFAFRGLPCHLPPAVMHTSPRMRHG